MANKGGTATVRLMRLFIVFLFFVLFIELLSYMKVGTPAGRYRSSQVPEESTSVKDMPEPTTVPPLPVEDGNESLRTNKTLN